MMLNHKKRKRRILVIFILLAIAAGTVFIYSLWNKKHREVNDETGISITASQLVKEFQTNEAEANKKYVDKAIQTSGIVVKIENKQDGNMTVLLGSDDPFTGVYCTLKNKFPGIKDSDHVVIKGFCSGMLTDVRLREAVIIK